MGKSSFYFYFFIFLLFSSLEIHASTVNSKVTFEGTLTDNNSNPIDLRTKTIYFYVYGSQSNCIYYAETSTSSGSLDGSIIQKIGSGSAYIGSYDASVFTTSTAGYSSSGVAGCSTVANEVRNLKVSVPDYSISTSIEITSVPSALNTELFSGKSLSQFLLSSVGTEQSILSVLTSQGTTGQYLTKTASSVAWASIAAPGAGVTSVSSSNSYLSVASSATTPVLTINVGQTSGTVAAGNDSRFSTSMQKSNNLSDLTSITTARANLGLGTLATLDSINLSTNVSGTLTTSNLPTVSGVAGTYGSLNSIPMITVDTYGRVVVAGSNAYQYADSINYGIMRVPTGANLTLSSGELTLTSSNVTSALGYTPASNSQATQWSTSGSSISYSGTIGIGSGAIDTGYGLSISGTTAAFKKIAIGGDQVMYKPDQTTFAGSFFIGDGGGSLSHATGYEGYYNTAVGISSLYSITTGSFNTSIGLNSLTYLTTGSYNTAVGVQSQERNSVASYNTSLGYFALRGATGVSVSGGYNSAFGNSSLKSITSGSDNTAVGSGSGINLSTGQQNTLIGNTAGETLTSGSNNTFIGKGAGAGITTGSYNTIIGPSSGITESNLSNYVIISDGSNNRRITIDSAGNTGIGTATPKATLDVNGLVKLKKYSSAPTCSSDNDGAIALTNVYITCVCNGSAWVKTSDGTTTCVWN